MGAVALWPPSLFESKEGTERDKEGTRNGMGERGHPAIRGWSMGCMAL